MKNFLFAVEVLLIGCLLAMAPASAQTFDYPPLPPGAVLVAIDGVPVTQTCVNGRCVATVAVTPPPILPRVLPRVRQSLPLFDREPLIKSGIVRSRFFWIR